MWERLERRAIRRRRIVRPDVGGRPRPDLPEGADLLPQIRHIVVLMMENHSYDNYLGMLADRGEGLPLGPGGTPDVVNYIPNGRRYPAHPAARHFRAGQGRRQGLAEGRREPLGHSQGRPESQG